MARAPYILDGRGFATKIKNARGQNWRSDASIACPNCNYTIDNTDVPQDWPGLPAGVKFDPSDQEIIKHLEQKVGRGNAEPHPFIEEFILTLKEESGICYTHPENLPGVKQDGSCIHVFHKTSKAYTTGHRKCRKITSDISSGGEVRWHKTGKTKPVMENGIQKGCKKIMVLYTSAKGSKAGKTNWVMHQYHLGTEEDEKEGEFVVSKVFYQQQTKQCEKSDPQVHREYAATSTSKGHPVTPNTSTPPLLLRSGKMHACLDVVKEEQMPWAVSPQAEYLDATIHQHSKGKDITYDMDDYFLNAQDDYELVCAGESQFYDDPQDLDSLLCSELFENQACQGTFKAESPMPDLSECGRIGGNESESRQKIVEAGNLMSSLPDYGYIGNHEHETGQSSGNHEPEKELIENNENNEPVCPALGNIVLDTPPDGPITFCGSQMSSQDSESLYQFTNPAI